MRRKVYLLGTLALIISYLLIIYVWFYIFIPQTIPYVFKFFIPGRPVNILVMGTDISYDEKSSVLTTDKSRTDTLMIVNLNPFNSKLNVLSIPRDTLVKIPDHGWSKINAAHVLGGTDLVKETIKKSFNLEIDKYVKIAIPELIKITDALGGLDIYVDKDMLYADRAARLNINLSQGWHNLKGKAAEGYVRFRHESMGDIGRVQHQQKFLKALFKKIPGPLSLLKSPWIISSVRTVDTDLSLNEMLKAANFMRMLKREDLRIIMLPGEFSDTAAASYWMPDLETDRKIIHKYFSWKGFKFFNSGLSQTRRIAVYNNQPDQKIVSAILKKLAAHGYSSANVQKNKLPELKSCIIAQKGDEKNARKLARLLGIKKIEILSIGDISADFTVIIGPDYK